MTIINRVLRFVLALLLLFSCRKEEMIVPPEVKPVAPGGEENEITGFYLLNEGNMGSNKATIDYFDYESGNYNKNIFAERNPGVVKELGDVGNDIQIYGSKLYIAVNCSHFVEVMDSKTAKHIATIPIPNCRYIEFEGRYAYVTSYAGPVEIDPNARLGYVAKVDTATLEVVAECTVGYQPEDMVICNGKLYVANSGGYRVPNYDNRVFVIDLESFQVVKTMEVGINLHRMVQDAYGNIYVSSRGDYYGTPSKTFIIDSNRDIVTDTLHTLPNSNMVAGGDSLYVLSNEFNYTTNSYTISYAVYDMVQKRIVSRNFISDGTEKKIKTPYGLAVNPQTREIFVTDAGDYVTPGMLYCFDRYGKLKWTAVTGDIPAHFAFTESKVDLDS
mgnify:CR=1 FL=1